MTAKDRADRTDGDAAGMGPPSPAELLERWKRAKVQDAACWVGEVGLFRKHTVRDADSLFRACAEAVYGSQRFREAVRKQCVQFFAELGKRNNLTVDRPINDYVKHMSDKNTHGGLNEVSIMSHLYRHDFVVIDSQNGPDLTFVHNYGSPIYLFHQSQIKHFDILMPIEKMKISAFCQSIAYTCLYEGVFSMSDVDRAVNHMLSDSRNESENKKLKKVNNLHSVDKLTDNFSGNDSFSLVRVDHARNSHFGIVNALKMLKNNQIPFPYKVARGLSPFVFKNLDFDIWFETKREEDMSINYSDGITLQVGVKCLCRIKSDQNEPFVCYIQSMKPDGQCTVFIEEMGEKKSVTVDQLEPLPINEAKPWFSPTKKGKMIPKYNQKRSKSCGRMLELWRDKNNSSTKHSSKLSSGIAKDPNNNYYDKENEFKGPVVGNIKLLKELTAIENFKPYPVDYVVAPFTVEQTAANGNPRETNGTNQPLSYSPAPISNGNGVTPYPAATVTTSPDVITTQYQNGQLPVSQPSLMVPPANPYVSSFQPMPIYCLPSVPISSVRAGMGYPPRPPMMPLGINYNVQRSIHNNGSDLPYNDIPTLRYFFNMGIEWMQSSSMMWSQSLPPPPQPSTPVGSNHPAYYYQPPVTPNQLALDIQNNLNLEENNNGQCNQEKVHYNHYQKSNGKYDNFKGGRGSHHGNRFRRNDFNNSERNNSKNNNFNRGTVIYNNKRVNNGRSNYNDNTPPGPGEKKEQNQDETNSPSTTPNLPCIPFPPPPLYRVPYFPIDGENPMIPPVYPPNYVSYGSSPDEGASSPVVEYGLPPGIPPGAPYMTYMTPPPPLYWSSPPNAPNYFPNPYPPQSNESPPKQQ